MYKVNNEESGRRQQRYSGVFSVNFEHISLIFPVFLLLSLNR